ncbi:5-methyltetrahydrofolate--homocysteine methyltransferase [Desulfonatronum thiosulfatophilum]|uniref:Methionine synthase n=1 Tax=Desulfonatronum thiosulfatophilum TaxID=617002 RepID=A0A1G6A7I5_9BACT|nr:homocysteine S-methyltransferase family protein [Desulfonatronum thiosulfatophilum]SDB04394.1 5-methyltetrahydrofolate--homocysteine methyltransferase [Desulfonatronum thiosulfatophilum]
MNDKVRSLIRENNILLFDGAMGTQLQDRGLQPGQSPEEFGDRHPEVIGAIHADYLQAGAMFLTTNTFGGTSFKLPHSLDPQAFNRKMAEVARGVAGTRGFVAGSVGPTGELLAPLGKAGFAELVDAFARQISGLAQGGADLILIETQFDLGEIRAAVVAARRVCDLPVAVSMTFESGTSLTGTSPLTFLDTMQNLGVDLIGTNCSLGPEGLEEIVRAMLPRARTPLLVQPNAGLPILENGRTVFPLQPQAFAERMTRFPALGVQGVGGCCGTSPAHVRAMAKAMREVRINLQSPTSHPDMVLTSRSTSVCVGLEEPMVVIGERINPTGKKQLTAQFQAGEQSLAMEMAVQQIAQGARILDVNVGAPMVVEENLLPELVSRLAARFSAPLSIDSSKVEAIGAALECYPGSALVNSISGEAGRMESLGPLCKMFGAPFVLLPLAGKDLPETSTQRLKIVESLLRKSEDLGIPRHLILVDALALTVSSKPESAKHCLQTIRSCREEWNLPTVLGLSNISFGLPARELLNSTFLTMAMSHGLCAVIAHPGARRVQEALAAGEVLLARDPQAKSFVRNYSGWAAGDGAVTVKAADSSTASAGAARKEVGTLGEAVIQGEKERILELLEQALDSGGQAGELLDQQLIPAIMEVGRRYESREFFLPQLILSAETMQKAFDRLTPLLQEQAGSAKKASIVMATVEGDIHDIGKNIVCLMLRNMGYEVHDLGKDVPARAIVQAAREKQAGLIGLSALMTTTMVRMEDTVRLVKEFGINTKVMVGGAVVTQRFADMIGADGYAPDAVAAVRVAARLIEETTQNQLTAS